MLYKLAFGISSACCIRHAVLWIVIAAEIAVTSDAVEPCASGEELTISQNQQMLTQEGAFLAVSEAVTRECMQQREGNVRRRHKGMHDVSTGKCTMSAQESA